MQRSARLALLAYDVFLVGSAFLVLIATFRQRGLVIEGIALGWTWVALATVWLLERRTPRSIVVAVDQLLFRTPSRAVGVPWAQLRSVGMTHMGWYRVRWRWQDGSLTAPHRYEDFAEILLAVKAFAPLAALEIELTSHGNVRRLRHQPGR